MFFIEHVIKHVLNGRHGCPASRNPIMNSRAWPRDHLVHAGHGITSCCCKGIQGDGALSKSPAGHLRHRAHLLLCCFENLMRIFAFFMLDCLVWFDLGSIPFWSQDRSRIVQNQSKSVQNRSKIGSKSVQNRFKIGPKSILERSWGVLGRPGAAWGYLVRFLIENRGSLDPPGPPSWVPKSTQID